MTFDARSGEFHPRMGKAMGLTRGHVDPSTLTLTFHYREWVHDGQKWNWELRQQTLVLNTHFRFDKRRGVIELLDVPFWHTIGRWAAGDREEELLYKGQVKYDRGQYVEFSYEHFAPEEVGDPGAVDLEEVDTEARTRLGYDLPRYSPTPKEKAPPAQGAWEWEELEVVTP